MRSNILYFLAMFVAVEHIWFGIMAFFRWRKGFAHDLLGVDDAEAERSQGIGRYLALHSAFIGIALLWSTILIEYDHTAGAAFYGDYTRRSVMVFLLFAGGIGGYFVNRSLGILQAVPAALWLIVARFF